MKYLVVVVILLVVYLYVIWMYTNNQPKCANALNTDDQPLGTQFRPHTYDTAHNW